MNYREPSNPEERRINEEATEWLSKIDRELSPSEQDRYLNWLADDPRHREWMGMQQRAWRDFERLSEWRPEHSDHPNPDLLLKRPSERVWARASLAIAAAIVMVFGYVYFNSAKESEFRIQHIVAEEYTYHLLDDGSEIDLNSGAAVIVDYVEDERRVNLVTGEAHFTVSKDPARPFIVTAGGSTVRAIGTAFNVRVSPQEVEVLVTEGRVLMEPEASERRFSDADTGVFQARELERGDRTIVALNDGSDIAHTDALETEQIDELLSWKPVVFEFIDAPLSEVVRAFNERNDIQLILADDRLESISIAASFRSNNIEGFAWLLENTTDVNVERGEGGNFILKSRKPQ